MFELLTYVCIYLVAVNLSAVVICCYDKTQARISGKRISEYNLFVLSIIGGAPAMYLTMQLIKHKTRKKRFMIGIPVIIVIQLALFVFFLLRF